MKEFRKFKLSLYFWFLVITLGVVGYSSGLSILTYSSPESLRPAPFALSPLPPLPIQRVSSDLNLSAKAYASLDLGSGLFLLGNRATTALPPASTSKLILAWVVRERCPLTQVITIDSSYQEGTVLGLNPGEKWSVESLLDAALLPSANDAAMSLAKGCFGQVETAVRAMNNQAKLWHLQSSHFTNPTGLDAEHNYTSAADLARVAATVLQDKVLANLVATSSKTIYDESHAKKFLLKNTNKLLGRFGIDGVKTGSTEAAGENLVVSTTLSGHRIVTVILGSSDRYSDTEKLLAEIGRVYRWQVEDRFSLGPVLGDSDSRK